MSGVIRVGDLVRVVEPFVVTRVGYPLSVDDCFEELRPHFSEIDGLVNRLSCSCRPVFSEDSRELYNVRRAFARARLAAKGWGGRERSLHGEVDEGLRGRVFVVSGKRNVVTGVYEPCRYTGGYFDEAEYEPAYLAKRETRVLLDLGVFARWNGEIEAVNVEKVEEL